MIPILGPLLGLISTGVERYAEHKKLESEQKLEIQKAKVRRIAKLDAADSNWDKIMAEASSSSWKDEFWTIVLAIPAVLAFFPDYVDAVQQGFKALETMPDWYKAAVGVAIAAAFGFRKFAQLKMK